MAEHSSALRVLVVDDDPTMVRLARGILRANGFAAVAAVGTAREALEALDQTDVVLLDHQLPDTNGLEVLDAIRSRPHPPAVIMVTAHGNESLAAAALRRGADDYLAKDASLAELLPQVLERVRRTRELRKALGAAERDLVRAERLAAIGEMTVTLHHEINNPLMSAFADVQLLLADPGSSPEVQRDTLRSIDASLRRIRDIVRQIGALREVRTKPYVHGVEMMDLASASGEAPALHRGTALLALADEDLARVVALLLRHAGFAVERQEKAEALRAAVDRADVSLVVVAGGTAAAGTHPLGGFDPPADRGYRVVALVSGEGDAARAAGADQVVQLPFDPGTFTTDIVEAPNRP
ncbi:MAG TPA: response regulator [Gemmatimonadales bacterium]|nr:response regulator [Gemmatimonadales bacterium]